MEKKYIDYLIKSGPSFMRYIVCEGLSICVFPSEEIPENGAIIYIDENKQIIFFYYILFIELGGRLNDLYKFISKIKDWDKKNYFIEDIYPQ